jgi:riboflavin synthase
MFTGIVTATGKVTRARRRKGPLELTVRARSIARKLKKGDSVAVNGVCLTAVDIGRREFEAEVVEETLERTTLSDIHTGDDVNLELAARPIDRLGGHIVQGHIDGTARLARIERDAGSTRMWWSAEPDVLRYVVEKGSVALDGVSLTVAGVGTSTFEVAIIPHTSEATTLGRLRVGDRANIEVDLMAKYVEKLIGAQKTGERA